MVAYWKPRKAREIVLNEGEKVAKKGSNSFEACKDATERSSSN